MKAGRRREAPTTRAEGAALLMALAMLVMFSMMGVAGIRFMTIELDETKYDLDLIGTRYQAYGGLNAAIGEIQSALEKGNPPQDAYELRMPLYTSVFIGKGKPLVLEEDPEKVHTVQVAVAVVQGGLAGELEGLGLKGDALAVIQANAPPISSGARYYRIASQATQKAGFRGQDARREEDAKKREEKAKEREGEAADEAPMLLRRRAPKVTLDVVALVSFQADGGYEVLFWKEGRGYGDIDESPAEAETAEVAEPTETAETEAVAPEETTETPQGSEN